MDERPLDPARVYLAKHTTRVVSAEVDHGLVMNQIGTATVTTVPAAHLRPIYRESLDRQLHSDRPGDQLHRRRRHDCEPGPASATGAGRKPSAAERLGTTGARAPRPSAESTRGRPESARGRSVDMIGAVVDRQPSARGRSSDRGEPGLDARRPCITCSFQAEDVVAPAHVEAGSNPTIPVLFLDTVHHFAQTYAYRDELAASWNLNLVNLRAAEPKPGLWQTSTDDCCARHKVGPLFSALEGYDSGSRACAVSSPRRGRILPKWSRFVCRLEGRSAK